MYQSSLTKKSRSESVGGDLRGEVDRRHLEQEVEDALHVVVHRVVRHDLVAEVLGDLAEHVEVADPLRPRVALDRGREPLPERVVDVLHRVHPEAVDAELADPELVDVDHPVDDARVLREQVVEPEEVAVLGVLADERRVAAVVVEAHVVEPGGDLDVRCSAGAARTGGRGSCSSGPPGGHGGCPVGASAGKVLAAGEVAVVEHRAGGGAVRVLVLGDVGRGGALLVADDVGRVVGDDVEVDLHPEPVGVADQRRAGRRWCPGAGRSA